MTIHTWTLELTLQYWKYECVILEQDIQKNSCIRLLTEII